MRRKPHSGKGIKPEGEIRLKKAYVRIGGGFMSREDRKRFFDEDEEDEDPAKTRSRMRARRERDPERRKRPTGRIQLKIAYIQGAGGFLSKEDRKRLYNEDED